MKKCLILISLCAILLAVACGGEAAGDTPRTDFPGNPGDVSYETVRGMVQTALREELGPTVSEMMRAEFDRLVLNAPRPAPETDPEWPDWTADGATPTAPGATTPAQSTAAAPASTTVTAPPGPTPEIHPSGDNVCDRSPEVRQALLAYLEVDSCSQVSGSDLYDIDLIQITAPTLKPGDLENLYELRELEIDGLQAPLTPGVFRDLRALVRLRIITQEPPGAGNPDASPVTLIQPGSFRGLDNLVRLEIMSSGNQGWASYDLNADNLEGLADSAGGTPPLRQLRLEHLGVLEQRSLTAFPNLTHVRLASPPPGDGETVPRVPQDLLSELPRLRSVSIHNLRWNPVITVASLDVACSMNGWRAHAPGYRDGGVQPLNVRVNEPGARGQPLEDITGCPHDEADDQTAKTP